MNCRIDSGPEQFFYPGFANGGAKSPYLGGVARQSRLVVVHPAEVLPDDVLRPSLDDGFVTQVVGMLKVQQRGHPPDQQLGPTGVADAASNGDRLTEEVVAFRRLIFLYLA